MRLEILTMSEFEKTKGRLIIIPFGSIEEHGPHLPLGTDAIIAYELVLAAAQKTDILAAPPIYYGVCRSTKEHPGTITISGRVLRNLTRDIIKGFVSQGCTRFILFSGHAGSIHMASLKEVGEELLEENVVEKIAILSILDLIDEKLGLETKNDSHAGELETSLMQYLHLNWVKGEAIEDYPHFPSFLLVKNKRRYWPSGIWGNPKVANPTKGKKFFAQLVQKLMVIIEKLKE